MPGHGNADRPVSGRKQEAGGCKSQVLKNELVILLDGDAVEASAGNGSRFG